MKLHLLLPACLLLCATLAPGAELDPARFGATPDDGADDTAALNRTCAAAAPGDTVRLARGTYIISGALTPHSATCLAGAGREATTLRDAGGAPHVMIRLEGMEQVEISGLTLDAAASPAVQQGIQAANSRKLNLHDLAIRNLVKSSGFGPHAIIFSKGVTDSVIADNRMTTIGLASEWGAGIRFAHGSSRNQVLGNVICATGRGGILAGNDCTTLVIRRNTVSGSGGTGLGIELWGGCGGALVEDNTIDHWLSIDRSSGSAIRRNVVSDKSGVFKHCGLELVSSCDCVFTGNAVDGGADVGISVSNKDPKNYIYWAANTVRGASTWAAQIQGEAGGAAYHYFYKNRFLDTPLNHPHARYQGNGHAVRFNDNARCIVLDGDEIAGNGGAAIQFLGKNLERMSFRNLTITGNAAVTSGRAPASLEWENNTMRGNRKDAAPAAADNSVPRPQAAFEVPARARAGQPVQFKNLSTVAEGSLQHVLWDFGQGLPCNEPNPTFTFAQSGKVLVTLLAWDERGGAARAERELTIQQ